MMTILTEFLASAMASKTSPICTVAYFMSRLILNLSIDGNQIILTVNLGAMSGKIEKSYLIAL